MNIKTTKTLSLLACGFTLLAYLIFLSYHLFVSDHATGSVAFTLLTFAFPFIGFSFIAVDFLPIKKVVPAIAQILLIPIAVFGYFMAFATTGMLAFLSTVLFIAFLVICILSIIGAFTSQRDETATLEVLKTKIILVSILFIALATFTFLRAYVLYEYI